MALISGIKLGDGSYLIKPPTVKLVGLCFNSDPLVLKWSPFSSYTL